MNLYILTLVMLDKIDVSLLSITFDKAENLNIPVKFSSVSVLYVAIAFETFVVSVDISLVVKLESNLNVVTKVMKVVSGSMITGVIEATANDLRLDTKLTFVASVRFEPDFALIDM
tara:strand:+ start:293 stop:640 length:348 start_codon:yes stop_codon:yes gene_type:complete